MTDITNFNNWLVFDISKIERGKEYVFYFPNEEYSPYQFGRITDDRKEEDLEFDYSDYQHYYMDVKKYGKNLPTHYFEIIAP